MNPLLSGCDSGVSHRQPAVHMSSFFKDLRGIFGFDLIATAPGVVEDRDCDDDLDAAQLTALGRPSRDVARSAAGVPGACN